jgi:hypothetical protein
MVTSIAAPAPRASTARSQESSNWRPYPRAMKLTPSGVLLSIFSNLAGSPLSSDAACAR